MDFIDISAKDIGDNIERFDHCYIFCEYAEDS